MLTIACRSYPWSLYAVFQTTLTQWAFALDGLLFACLYFALVEAGFYAVDDARQPAAAHWQRSLVWALFVAHWVFSKTIKLVPHLLRNPGDVRFIPVSILFGYFHNLIKLYGCITVTEVRSSPTASPPSLPRPRLTTCVRRPGARARAPMPTTTSECCPSRPWRRSLRH